ncbi:MULTISPECIES: type VI secretion system lipoprotein IglE [Francisella]|uniref:Type VI lipoprotein IgE-like C-terminal domain-containing protein n=1 Tax=Francisella opportunistica TaxID=2016517 RepID=A0A345JTJ5_9GAMM|nr:MULTISPECIES: type VI secretion system lipoprotein IglE [Francisella]APC92440.1 hypothetical protein BBG19_1716 [Francisella sp. MA067296]AXH30641.1 hypothetical protein CGC43_08695 [Francisella opportunistica]AXH32281.1 hypothetical protein CGC44_08665 [Francisella opportunistica]AXH33930.1 hypothetical protein CGC45_08725 [Francisella opportunistica]
MKNIRIKHNYFKNIKLALLAILFLILTGCASSSFDLTVQPDKLTNNGQPFYVIVKDEPMFSYLDSSINSVYESYLKSDDKHNSFLIYPNKGKQSISIQKSKKDGVSVYFLFQKKPSVGDWKFYINSDSQKDKTINITKNNLVEVS